jgi:beta-glucosidase
VVVGTSDEEESESGDRESTALPGGQDELVRRVLAANSRTVVVVNAAAAVDMPWSDHAAAVLCTWFGGQELGPALADVLSGVREPGGRLPITIAADPGDYPAYDTRPDADGRLRYEESIFVGYRHFDARARTPRFPFGHGHGYTDFAYERMVLSAARIRAGERVRVEVDVRNAGARTGKEIVQLYVADPVSALARPPAELKAFAAVTLTPGEGRTVALELDERAFAYWHPGLGSWHAEAGEFEIRVGRSSRDIRLSQHLLLE